MRFCYELGPRFKPEIISFDLMIIKRKLKESKINIKAKILSTKDHKMVFPIFHWTFLVIQFTHKKGSGSTKHSFRSKDLKAFWSFLIILMAVSYKHELDIIGMSQRCVVSTQHIPKTKAKKNFPCLSSF